MKNKTLHIMCWMLFALPGAASAGGKKPRPHNQKPMAQNTGKNPGEEKNPSKKLPSQKTLKQWTEIIKNYTGRQKNTPHIMETAAQQVTMAIENPGETLDAHTHVLEALEALLELFTIQHHDTAPILCGALVNLGKIFQKTDFLENIRKEDPILSEKKIEIFENLYSLIEKTHDWHQKSTTEIYLYKRIQPNALLSPLNEILTNLENATREHPPSLTLPSEKQVDCSHLLKTLQKLSPEEKNCSYHMRQLAQNLTMAIKTLPANLTIDYAQAMLAANMLIELITTADKKDPWIIHHTGEALEVLEEKIAQQSSLYTDQETLKRIHYASSQISSLKKDLKKIPTEEILSPHQEIPHDPILKKFQNANPQDKVLLLKSSLNNLNIFYNDIKKTFLQKKHTAHDVIAFLSQLREQYLPLLLDTTHNPKHIAETPDYKKTTRNYLQGFLLCWQLCLNNIDKKTEKSKNENQIQTRFIFEIIKQHINFIENILFYGFESKASAQELMGTYDILFIMLLSCKNDIKKTLPYKKVLESLLKITEQNCRSIEKHASPQKLGEFAEKLVEAYKIWGTQQLGISHTASLGTSITPEEQTSMEKFEKGCNEADACVEKLKSHGATLESIISLCQDMFSKTSGASPFMDESMLQSTWLQAYLDLIAFLTEKIEHPTFEILGPMIEKLRNFEKKIYEEMAQEDFFPKNHREIFQKLCQNLSVFLPKLQSWPPEMLKASEVYLQDKKWDLYKYVEYIILAVYSIEFARKIAPNPQNLEEQETDKTLNAFRIFQENSTAALAPCSEDQKYEKIMAILEELHSKLQLFLQEAEARKNTQKTLRTQNTQKTLRTQNTQKTLRTQKYQSIYFSKITSWFLSLEKELEKTHKNISWLKLFMKDLIDHKDIIFQLLSWQENYHSELSPMYEDPQNPLYGTYKFSEKNFPYLHEDSAAAFKTIYYISYFILKSSNYEKENKGYKEFLEGFVDLFCENIQPEIRPSPHAELFREPLVNNVKANLLCAIEETYGQDPQEAKLAKRLQDTLEKTVADYHSFPKPFCTKASQEEETIRLSFHKASQEEEKNPG